MLCHGRARWPGGNVGTLPIDHLAAAPGPSVLVLSGAQNRLLGVANPNPVHPLKRHGRTMRLPDIAIGALYNSTLSLNVETARCSGTFRNCPATIGRRPHQDSSGSHTPDPDRDSSNGSIRR